MKMNKKIFALLLAGAMVFAAACGSATTASPTPETLPEIENDIAEAVVDKLIPEVLLDETNEADDEELVSDTVVVENDNKAAFSAYKNLSKQLSTASNESTQYEMNLVTEMDMTIDGFSISSGKMDGNLKMIVDGDRFEYAMVMDMSSMGAGLMEMYHDGITTYYAIDGIEYPIDFDIAMNQFDTSVNLPDFEEEAIKSIIEKEINGNIEYTIVIDGDMMADFALESMQDGIGDLGFEFDIEIDDIEMMFLVDENEQPINFSIVMKMKMDIEGIEAVMFMKMTYEVIKWGEGVVIEMPSA